MSTRLAFLSDLHMLPIGTTSTNGTLYGAYAQTMLLRALHWIADCDLADAVILCGDLLNSPQQRDAKLALEAIRQALEACPLPTLVCFGNNDPASELCFSVFQQPDFLDVGNCRIIPFYDQFLPGGHAFRPAENLQKMREARANFSGELVFVQHVPFFPAQSPLCPFRYQNSTEIETILQEQFVSLCVGGHHHPGTAPYYNGTTTFACVPALSRAPFQFAVATLPEPQSAGLPSPQRWSWELHSLQLPMLRHWCDCHTHTHLAYCNENMNFAQEAELMKLWGLERLVVTEHSSHLMYQREHYKSKSWFSEKPEDALLQESRIAFYHNDLRTQITPSMLPGTELDVNTFGQTVTTPELLHISNFRLGAIHYLPTIAEAGGDDEFFRLARALIESGLIHSWAHPFRIFFRAKIERHPTQYFEALAELLRKNHVAVELNSHKNHPDPEFTRCCIEHGVKVTLGSDAHNLYEIGYLFPQLDFLRQLGYPASCWDEIILPMEPFFSERSKG